MLGQAACTAAAASDFGQLSIYDNRRCFALREKQKAALARSDQTERLSTEVNERRSLAGGLFRTE